MITTILMIVSAAIGAALALLLFLASRKPDQFQIDRSVYVNAPASAIFPLINDLRNHMKWSPYFQKDPAMKSSIQEPYSGTGALMKWDGDNRVGKGALEILDLLPEKLVSFKLTMIKPIKAENNVRFSLEAEGNRTRVTWAMHGPINFFGKIIHTLIDCDKMAGKDFEAGLSSLKAIAEQ